MTAYLDTHVAAWLYGGELARLSGDAKRHIDRDDLLISPMAFLELQYLYRRKRVTAEANEIYLQLHGVIGLKLCTLPFAAVAMEVLNCDWTDDPFDRIIVSQAKANSDAGLITSDLKMRKNYASAIW